MGNNRPTILVKLEDCVLEAVLDILGGKLTETVIDALYLRVELLQKHLGNDDEALNWFALSRPAPSAPLTPAHRPTQLAGQSIHLNSFVYLANGFPQDKEGSSPLLNHPTTLLFYPSHHSPPSIWVLFRLPNGSNPFLTRHSAPRMWLNNESSVF